MSEPAQPWPRFPGLTLRRVLGSGMSGRVFLAEQETLGRQVAVKVLDGQYAEDASTQLRFAREAALLATNPHPALLSVLHAELDASPPYLVLPYMQGGDLRRAVSERLAPEVLLEAGRRVADALAHLHEHGIVHRDIKPENLFQDASGAVFLGDLGLIRGEHLEALTRTDHVVGTPVYLAPELLKLQAYSPASDVYALGMTLAELLLGRLPRDWQRPAAPLDMRDQEVPIAGLAGLLRECLRVDPADRLGDAGELRDRLEALQRKLAEGAEAGEDWPGPGPGAETIAPASAAVSPRAPPGLDAASPGYSAPPRPPPGRVAGWAALAFLCGLLLGHLGLPEGPGELRLAGSEGWDAVLGSGDTLWVRRGRALTPWDPDRGELGAERSLAGPFEVLSAAPGGTLSGGGGGAGWIVPATGPERRAEWPPEALLTAGAGCVGALLPEGGAEVLGWGPTIRRLEGARGVVWSLDAAGAWILDERSEAGGAERPGQLERTLGRYPREGAPWIRTLAVGPAGLRLLGFLGDPGGVVLCLGAPSEQGGEASLLGTDAGGEGLWRIRLPARPRGLVGMDATRVLVDMPPGVRVYQRRHGAPAGSISLPPAEDRVLSFAGGWVAYLDPRGRPSARRL